MSRQPEPIVYDGDTRYPGPSVHPPPADIQGIPTQQELDAQARMFTWGELKEIIHSGDLELLMRNKRMQARYDTWMLGMKQKFGSTEAYLTQARLPWSSNQVQAPASPTYDLHLDPLPPRAPSPSSPHLEPPSPSSPSSYPYPPPPMSPKGEPSPNLLNPVAGTGLTLNVDVSQGQGELLKPRHGRTPSITISPSEPTPPENPITRPKPAPAPVAAVAPISPAMKATLIETPGNGSGTSTPSSVGFVSLSSLNLVNGKLRRSNPGSPTKKGSGSSGVLGGSDQEVEQGHDGDEEEGEEAEYLRWEGWLDGAKYAVLPNDWPYNIPYGVRHYCVWSRIPIAHPDLVDYSPEAWSKIESEGLGGFTGVTPLYRRKPIPRSSSPSPTSDSGSGFTSPVNPNAGRTKNLGHMAEDEWYAVDVDYSGEEKKKWAGREYEAQGGKEVGRMVRGLWDERGWECLWFVNPPRLQSVPGFSHFHVFARRKTPEEIDAAEAAIAANAKNGLKADGQSTLPRIST